MIGSQKILYVDDNAKTRKLLGSFLEESGYEVTDTEDPFEAMEMMGNGSFHLALLDYQMPQLSGARLAEMLKTMSPDLPVVLISGLAFLPPEDSIWVDAHVGRGSTLDELVDAIRIQLPSRPQHLAFGSKTYMIRPDST